MIKTQNQKPESVPPFLAKTYEILMSNEFEDTITWALDGHGFIVKNISQFEKTVLPRFFKHNKFSSFIRQLNMYDFHKIRHKGDQKEFKHIFFCKDEPELLVQIKRKTPDQVEANDKKLKEALTIADKWKKLEGRIDIFDSDHSQPDLETAPAGDSLTCEVSETKDTADLMMCLVIYNKALKKEGSNSSVTSQILKQTQDYINSIKSLVDMKDSKTSTTLPDCSETCSLGKRSCAQLDDIENDFDEEFNYCQQKKLKTCDDFALKREDSSIIGRNFNSELAKDAKMTHEDFYQVNNFASDEHEIEDFCKLTNWDNFQMSLGEFCASDNDLYNAYF